MKHAMPPARTSAIVAIWPFSWRSSRKSFRSRAGMRMPSPPQVARGDAVRDEALVLHAPVGQGDDAIGHLGDRRVVRDDRGGRAELPIHALDDVEHHDAGPEIQGAGGLVAEEDRG